MSKMHFEQGYIEARVTNLIIYVDAVDMCNGIVT